MSESPQDSRSASPSQSAKQKQQQQQQQLKEQQQQQQNQKVQPQKLELILHPEDGSLQTAPLLSVITACTDSLYRDIYDMAHGELQIVGGAGAHLDGSDEPNSNANTAQTNANTNVRRKDKMSNLSFAARRHELSYRLASHSKALTHVAALTASNHSDGASANLEKFVGVSTKALAHARTAWIQNDECQDAMYFFHGRLFSLRAGPHDVYGALDFMTNRSGSGRGGNVGKNTIADSNINGGSSDNKENDKNASDIDIDDDNDCVSSFWYDLPSDIKLETDRYETSAEQQWSKQEVSDRWQMAVRRKLLLGEVGCNAARQQQQRQPQPQSDQQHQQEQQQSSKGRSSVSARLADKVPWKISLKGGIVRLMHGTPKETIDNVTGKTKTLYPLEAVLTVLTTDSHNSNDATELDGEGNANADVNAKSNLALDQAEWTLISVDVYAQAKTGQSNHQLDTTNKQRYNLHRLCALAMAREERQTRLQMQEQQQEQQVPVPAEPPAEQEGSSLTHVPPIPIKATVAQPLNALFRVAQYFSLSWQLEILSEQAKALSKGNWGGSGSSGDGRGLGPSVSGGRRMGGSSSAGSYSIVVTPVKFFENRTSRILGVLSISFWAIDDRYGPPSMGDLVRLDDEEDDEDDTENENKQSRPSGSGTENDSVSTVSRSVQNPAVTNMLTLSVRAEPDVGIKVSLSGADSMMEFASHSRHGHVRSTIVDLLEATSNPFALSASEALLAATILCAERKCYAMVEALPGFLPPWITLTVEKGSIVVAANIQYYTAHTPATATSGDGSGDGTATASTTATTATPIQASAKPVVLFKLACDSRTGSFVPTFSRSTPLLQHMACNDVRAASDTTLLRIANLSKLRRSRTTKAASAGAMFGSGRVVRDAFESLSRSMNVLGQRTGVGGAWKDHDDRSTLLRQRAIGLAGKDVKVSLMSSCGMAVLYGLSAVSIGVATGIAASPEMAGGKPFPGELAKAMAAAGLSSDKGTNSSSFMLAPPPSLLIDQKIVEHVSWTHDGERLKKSLAEQERFGICCSVDEEKGLILYGAEIKTQIESPSSIPTRKEFELVPFVGADPQDTIDGAETSGEGIAIAPPSKRAKTEGSNASVSQRKVETRDLIDEVAHFAGILAQTIGI